MIPSITSFPSKPLILLTLAVLSSTSKTSNATKAHAATNFSGATGHHAIALDKPPDQENTSMAAWLMMFKPSPARRQPFH